MHFGRATSSNVTIDDTVPNSNQEAVIYDPPSAWNSRDFCPRGPCSISPDTNQVQSGTWHESTFHAEPNRANDFPNQPLSATARFRGSAVYVYAVLPPATGTKAPTAAITFYIDGVLVKDFSHSSGPDYVYDFLVYANSSLSPDSHEIKITNGKVDGIHSLFILDRIVYSTISNDPPSIPSASVGTDKPIPTSTQGDPKPASSSGQTSSISTSLAGSISTFSTRDPSTTIFSNTTPIPLPQDPLNSPHRSLSPGAIVGIVLGSLAGIIAIFIAVLYRRQRRNSLRQAYPGDITSYANRTQAGWVVASDSKRDILRATSHPPIYQS